MVNARSTRTFPCPAADSNPKSQDSIKRRKVIVAIKSLRNLEALDQWLL